MIAGKLASVEIFNPRLLDCFAAESNENPRVAKAELIGHDLPRSRNQRSERAYARPRGEFRIRYLRYERARSS